MIQCNCCFEWIHTSCEQLTEEDYHIFIALPETIKYICQVCQVSNKKATVWRKALNSARQNGIIRIINLLLTEPEFELLHCPSSSGKHSTDNTDLQNICSRLLTDLLDHIQGIRPASLEIMSSLTYQSVGHFNEDFHKLLRHFYLQLTLANEQFRLICSAFEHVVKRIFPWFSYEISIPFLMFGSTPAMITNTDHTYHQMDKHSKSKDGANCDIESFLESSQHVQIALSSSSLQYQNFWYDKRFCILCLQKENENSESGRLIAFGTRQWIHANCVLWSKGVCQMHDGKLKGVQAAVKQGEIAKCTVCFQFGATLYCCYPECTCVYHFPCARCAIDVTWTSNSVFCPNHGTDVLPGAPLLNTEYYLKIIPEITSSEVCQDVCPSIGALNVIQLGSLVTIPDRLFLDGYQCVRFFWGIRDPEKRVAYHFSLHSNPPSISTWNPPDYTITHNCVQSKFSSRYCDFDAKAHSKKTNIFVVKVAESVLNSVDQIDFHMFETEGLSADLLEEALLTLILDLELHANVCDNGNNKEEICSILQVDGATDSNDAAECDTQTLYETKCPRCKRVYRTVGSCLRHQEQCEYDVDSSSSSSSSSEEVGENVEYAEVTGSTASESVSCHRESEGMTAGSCKSFYKTSNVRCDFSNNESHIKPFEEICSNEENQSIGKIENDISSASSTSPAPNIYFSPVDYFSPHVPMNEYQTGAATYIIPPLFMYFPSVYFVPSVPVLHLNTQMTYYTPVANHALFAQPISLAPSLPAYMPLQIPNSYNYNGGVTMEDKTTSSRNSGHSCTQSLPAAPVLEQSTQSDNTVSSTDCIVNWLKEMGFGDFNLKVLSLKSQEQDVPKNMVVIKPKEFFTEPLTVEMEPEAGSLIKTSGFIYELRSSEGIVFRANNLSSVWSAALEAVETARAAKGLPFYSICSLSDLKLCGLSNSNIRKLIQQLPIDKEITENQGCARIIPFKNRSDSDMFSWLASHHRPLPIPSLVDVHVTKSRMPKTELPLAMQYRHLKETCRNAVGVFRSDIHGRGLFSRRAIEQGEMVIEYAGQLIRPLLADKRERLYEAKGIGCYMFRIDDLTVVDATTCGNAARFINHSCDPNCFSRVVDILGRKRIIIFALRYLYKGEELTYDYKFPIEDVKIPCNCLSRKCRKYMN